MLVAVVGPHALVGEPVDDLLVRQLERARDAVAHGVVRVISPDSFTQQDEQRNPTGSVPMPPTGSATGIWYRARVSLDEVKLHDIPKGFHLMPGMAVTADILVGKRSIMGYLFGKFAPLATEAMREP